MVFLGALVRQRYRCNAHAYVCVCVFFCVQTYVCTRPPQRGSLPLLLPLYRKGSCPRVLSLLPDFLVMVSMRP